MRRFHWPLQRLLDVTVQRERSHRAEVLALSRQTAAVRQQVLLAHAELRAALAELAGQQLAQRLAIHGLYARSLQARQRRIERLEAQLQGLLQRRAEKTVRLLRCRSRRQTLERLREEARRKHLHEQEKLQQKQFDETAHLAKAREAMGRSFVDSLTR